MTCMWHTQFTPQYPKFSRHSLKQCQSNLVILPKILLMTWAINYPCVLASSPGLIENQWPGQQASWALLGVPTPHKDFDIHYQLFYTPMTRVEAFKFSSLSGATAICTKFVPNPILSMLDSKALFGLFWTNAWNDLFMTGRILIALKIGHFSFVSPS